MNWRDMTLSEVYQYWILGLVPDDDIPYVACNDMLAGNMTDEIVDLAGLSRPDAWELARLLPRAFAQLELQPMTEKEAAKRVAMPLRREIAQRIVSGEGDPLWGANAIYDYAANAGVYRDRGDADNQVAKYGTDFLQLADALEWRQDDSEQKRYFQRLIVESAEALLAGQPVPAWGPRTIEIRVRKARVSGACALR